MIDEDIPLPEGERGFGEFETNRLKPEVLEWLKTNVKDVEGEDHKQGWCVGTDKYNARSGISFSIFFQRVKDAKAFAKQWSSYKNLFTYLNYFADKRYKLNLKTGRMQRAPR